MEEVLPFKVLEFDRDDKRIIVSHTRVNEDVKIDEKKAVEGEKKAVAKKTKEAVEKTNSKIEKSTLGDLSALSDLKTKMEGNAKD